LRFADSARHSAPAAPRGRITSPALGRLALDDVQLHHPGRPRRLDVEHPALRAAGCRACTVVGIRPTNDQSSAATHEGGERGRASTSLWCRSLPSVDRAALDSRGVPSADFRKAPVAILSSSANCDFWALFLGRQKWHRSCFGQVATGTRLASPDAARSTDGSDRHKGWWTLAALAALVVACAALVVRRPIPTTVQGTGILLARRRGVRRPDDGGGQVMELHVTRASRSRRVRVIGRVAQPELVRQISEAQQVIHRPRGAESVRQPATARRIAVASQHARSTPSRARDRHRITRSQILWLTTRLAQQQEARRIGL